MPSLPHVFSRTSLALTGTRPRRAALALAALAAFVGALAVSATFALVGTPPAAGTQTALDLVATAAILGFYVLAARSVRWAGRVDAPLRALWEPLLLIVDVVVGREPRVSGDAAVRVRTASSAPTTRTRARSTTRWSKSGRNAAMMATLP